MPRHVYDLLTIRFGFGNSFGHGLHDIIQRFVLFYLLVALMISGLVSDLRCCCICICCINLSFCSVLSPFIFRCASSWESRFWTNGKSRLRLRQNDICLKTSRTNAGCCAFVPVVHCISNGENTPDTELSDLDPKSALDVVVSLHPRQKCSYLFYFLYTSRL